jgi:putative glutamate/gamma-aminobutyrate antiporter
MNKPKILSVFSLVMINVIAVNNLKTLPFSAQFGTSLIFFYLIAAFLFFIPSALVSAELATGWPSKGGIYVWVREAFGKRMAFLSIWLQWVYNVVWYPSILAFMAVIFAYLIDPALAKNKFYMLSMVVGSFWLCTLINLFGMKISSWISSFGALIGIIVPTIFITTLGAFWVFMGKPLQITMNWENILPDFTHFNNLAFLVAVLFGLIGMEMSAVHADEVKNPQTDYPKALLYSVFIILSALILASLAIACVIPKEQINIASGVIDAFLLFFAAFHLQWMLPIIIVLMLIGSLSSVTSWIIGPTKGLLVASEDGNLPKLFQQTNAQGVPAGLLIIQGIIVTILSSVFLFMPSINSSYWILSAMTAQLALIFYLFLFAAALKLRYSKPDQHRAFKVPGGKIGIWMICTTAMLTCVIVIFFGFLPPPDMQINNIYVYEGILIAGMVLFCLPPFFIYRSKSTKKTTTDIVEEIV